MAASRISSVPSRRTVQGGYLTVSSIMQMPGCACLKVSNSKYFEVSKIVFICCWKLIFVSDQNRKYDWIEYEDGRILGKKGQCASKN